MALFTSFLSRLLVCSVLILLVLMGMALLGGGHEGVLRSLLVWGAFALTLAAFPAGIAVARDVFPGGRLALGPLAWASGACALVSLLVLVLAGWLGPMALRGNADRADDPMTMTLGELRDAARAAAERAEAAPDPTLADWLPANRLAWHYVRRTDGSALPFMFGLLGLLVGYWSSKVERVELVRAQQWAMGIFLLVSTYLAGENGFELVAMRSSGPAFFAGDFVLIVPATLLVALGWSTLVATALPPGPTHAVDG
jgi:uncharacterized membrane protein